MKKLVLSVVFAAGTVFAPGAILNVSAAGAAGVCDGDVPEAWKRPGGYCEQIDGGSLAGPGDPCRVLLLTWLPKVPGGRVLVASAIEECRYSYPVL